MNRSDISLLFFLFMIILSFAMPLHAMFISWPPKVYEGKKAIAELRKAWATNDLTYVKEYLGNALKFLEKYEGNPSWWYPTPHTDWERIKQAIEITVEQIENVEGDPTSYTYQQMVHNLGEYEIPEMINQIENTLDWITTCSRRTSIFITIDLIGWIACAILGETL